MNPPALFAAIDLGASSARLFAGELRGGRLLATEVTRLANRPVRLPDGWHWDVLRIHQGMLEGLAALSRKVEGGPLWAGFDGWGVDYGLVDAAGHLLGLPFSYRDERTAGCLGRATELLGPGRAYHATGIQEMEINTLYQLMAERGSSAYEKAAQLLMFPDLLAYFLTGVGRFERTNASTTQCVDVRTGGVVRRLLEQLSLRSDLFPPAVSPGEIVGPVLKKVAESVDIRSPVSVVAVGSHDTASAVLAVPAAVPDFAYVVSGTWSLVGFELDVPVIDEATRQANFSNEMGVDRTIRFLRNAMGHWMLQESERAWAQAGRPRDLRALVEEAAALPPFLSLVDTSAPEFSRPGNMPERVRRACARNLEPVPETDGALVRCILDSMALAIGVTLEDAERCCGRKAQVVHLVGGGAGNRLLADLLASVTGLELVAGPLEASAVGNLLVQLRTAGLVGDRAEMRALVSSSFPLRRVAPVPELCYQAKLARERLSAMISAAAERR